MVGRGIVQREELGYQPQFLWAQMGLRQTHVD